MNLHFVQSLETLHGGGLGQAALSLHLAMSKLSDTSENKNIIKEDCLKDYDTLAGQSKITSSQVLAGFSGRNAPKANTDNSTQPCSILVTTRSRHFKQTWPGVIQGIRWGPNKLFFSPELRHLAQNAIKDASVFHGHGLYVWTNLWLGKEARHAGKPLVYHVHGFFEPWILKRSAKKKALSKLIFESENMKYVQWWRALSTVEAQQIRNNVGDQAKIHVIPNGINLDEIDGFSSKQYHASLSDCNDINDQNQMFSLDASGIYQKKREKRLLFLSRIHPKKGLDILIASWSILTADFPDWELVIVGPNEQGYQQNIQRLINSSKCSETCRILPPVSGFLKSSVFRSSDLLVLPSYSEGFPMVLLEAAAYRLPIVQTFNCNFPELDIHDCSWSCRPEIDDLTRILRISLSASDKERYQRGENGRRLVETKYSWSQISKTILDITSSYA
ncbi:MAG: glycosyltransferase [bacterium]